MNGEICANYPEMCQKSGDAFERLVSLLMIDMIVDYQGSMAIGPLG
jgi:hypothetical protein